MVVGSALVVCEDADVTRTVCAALGTEGFHTTHSVQWVEALAAESGHAVDLVVLDMARNETSPCDIIQGIKSACPKAHIIVTSAEPTITTAIESLRAGVFDYICRPHELYRLAISARKALLEQAELPDKRPASTFAVPPLPAEPIHRSSSTTRLLDSFLVGTSPAIMEAKRLILEVAPSDLTVLIRGESGTGKDVVARLIHRLSKRNDSGSFVKINCPAIPETLLESELFGHERGAFTGAIMQKPGRFELAQRGTIFLDEIGSVSMNMQSKLLEVIEHKQFMRVGGSRTVTVDTRIVAATNSPLEKAIAQSEFRADLFYRLKQFTITLPPLRERVQDIPLLCEHFIRAHADKHGLAIRALPPHILALLIRYEWPGNVRELQSVIARYTLSNDLAALEHSVTRADGTAPATDKLRSVEAAAIAAALNETRWNRRKAANRLGISYSALRRRMAKYNFHQMGA